MGSPDQEDELLVCPTCQAAHPVGTEACPYDGTALPRTPAAAPPPAQAAEPDPLVGMVIDGRYAVKGRIGEGGMGIVYCAEQVQVGRLVAVKVLHRQMNDAATLARFENEAKIISQLRHPNTLRLIDFGRMPEGRLYLVTELLDGMPLDQVMSKGPLGVPRTLSILRQICESLAEAHQRGIIHRDLKPQNVFLDQVGDREVVKVLDFGIAKASSQSVKTATGVVVGTPAYMSPEQAQGAKVDAKTDLYSLGVIAYQCLSGRLPFDAETPVGLLVKHVMELPPALSTLDLPAQLPPDLEPLVMGLLSKSPQLRPASANEVRDTIERLERHTRSSGPISPILDRNVGGDIADLATMMLPKTPAPLSPEGSAAGLPVPTPLPPPPLPTPVPVAPARDTKESAAVHLLDTGSTPAVRGTSVTSAPRRQRWIAARIFGALLGIGGAIALYAIAFNKGEKKELSTLHSKKPVRPTFKQLTDQPGVERDPSLSPDAKFIAYASDKMGHWDVYLLRVGGERAINLTEQSTEDETAPAFSPDGTQIAFASSRSGSAIYLMGSTGEAVRRLAERGFNPAWSPDGKEVFYVTEQFADPASRFSVSELWSIEVATSKTRKVFGGDAMQPQVSPHGERIAYWANNAGQRDIFTIDRAGKTKPVPVTNDKALDYNPLWSPSGDELYFLSDRSGSINLWRIAIHESSGKTQSEPEPVTSGATSISQVTIAPNGLFAYTAEIDTYSLKQYAFDSTHLLCHGEATLVLDSSKPLRFFDISPDGKHIAYWVATGEVLGIMSADGSARRVLVQDESRARGPAFSPDGKTIAYYTNKTGDYRVWLMNADGSGSRMLTDGAATINAVWSPDGKRIATSEPSKGTRIFTVSESAPTTDLPLLEGTLDGDHAFQASSWSPNGEELAGSLSGNGKPAIYSLSSHKLEILPLPPEGQSEGEVVWLHDGKHLLFQTRHEISAVDRKTGAKKKILTVPKGDVFLQAAVTKDGKHLYTLSKHGEADLWTLSLE